MPRCEIGDCGKLKFAMFVQAIDQQDEEIHDRLRIGEQSVHGLFRRHGLAQRVQWGVGMPFAHDS